MRSVCLPIFRRVRFSIVRIVLEKRVVWTGTIRVSSCRTFGLSPCQSAAVQSVVSSSRIILTTLPFLFPDNYGLPTPLLLSKPRRRPLPRRQEDRRGLLRCHLRRSALLSPHSPVLSSNLNPFFATGTNLLNSQTVAIKFVSPRFPWCPLVLLFTVLTQPPLRNLERLRRHS